MMHYTTTGSGQPLVLVHGFGEDSRIWTELVNALKNYVKIILPDLPGTGQSIPDANLSIASMADGLAAILDAEKIEKATIIGHSMGGYITLAFAEKFPERLLAFGLVHSTAFADSELKITARGKSIEFIRQYGSALYLESTIPNLFAPENRSVMDKIIRDIASSNAYILPAALITFLEAMIKRKDTTQVLRQCKVPVLFIVGTQDQAVPFTDTMQQVHLPEFSYIHILRQSGHMGMLEEPENCTNAIIQFLTRPG